MPGNTNTPGRTTQILQLGGHNFSLGTFVGQSQVQEITITLFTTSVRNLEDHDRNTLNSNKQHNRDLLVAFFMTVWYRMDFGNLVEETGMVLVHKIF